MVSSRAVCMFWTKNTAFSAECKEKGSKITPSASLRSAAPPRGRLWAMPQGLPLPQKAVPLGKVASPQAMAEGVSSQPLPRKKKHRNARRCSGAPRFNKNDQIRLRASSSPTRMKSGCSCRMLAGTSGVTGPKKAFLTISALPAPLTTISTLRACMMVRMPMV